MMTPEKRKAQRSLTHIDDIGPSEKSLQTIAGAVFGLLIGGGYLLRLARYSVEPSGFHWLLGLVLIPALVAILARLLGNRLWFSLRRRPRLSDQHRDARFWDY